MYFENNCKKMDNHADGMMGSICKASLLLALAFLLPGQAGAAALSVVENDQAQAAVITAEEPTPIASYAAKELIEHIKKSTGVELDHLHEGQSLPNEKARIFVGETAAAARQGINADALGPDEFVLKTIDGDLYILGQEKEQADPLDTDVPWGGTLFGVYEILEQHVGVRWLWPGELGTYIPQHERLTSPELEETIEPSLKFARYRTRGVGTGPLAFSEDVAESYEHDRAVYQRRHRLSSGRRPGSAHKFSGWWSKYGDEHPEWFAMNEEGERKGPTMCVSEPSLHEYIINEDWDGGDRLFLQEVDNAMYCRCDQCMSWDAEDSRIGGTYITPDRYAKFWKTIYEKAVERNPDVQVLAYLYQRRFPAPKEDIKLNENIQGQFVPWAPFYSHTFFPMPEDNLQSVKDWWQGWAETGMTMTYRPNHTLAGYVMPHINMRQGGGFFQFAYERGMVGTDFDSLVGHWAVRGPEHYMYHRLMSHPERSIEAILDDFYSGFGPAADYVREYFDYWEEYNKELRQEGRWNNMWLRIGTADEQYPPEAFEPAEQLLEQAMKAARGAEREVFAERVRFLQKGLEHARLAVQFMRIYHGSEEELSLERSATPERVEKARRALQKLVDFRKENEALYISDFGRPARLERRHFELIDELLDPDGQIVADEIEGDSIHVLPNVLGEWRFRKDPDNVGVEQNWYAAKTDSLIKHYRPNGEPLPHDNWSYQVTKKNDLHDPEKYRDMTWHGPDNAWLSSGKGRRYTFYTGDQANAGVFPDVEGAAVHRGSERNVLIFKWNAPESDEGDVTFDGYLGRAERFTDRIRYGILDHKGQSLASGIHDPVKDEGNIRPFEQTFSGIDVVEGKPLYMYAWTDDERVVWEMTEARGAPQGDGIRVDMSSAGEDDWQSVEVPQSWIETDVGRYYGYGWYRTRVDIPEMYADSTIHLLFQGVDEQAWVYWNGRPVAEHTVESEEKSIGELWDEPFVVEIPPEHVNVGENNHLFVRVHASANNAGIWRPVQVYLED